MRILIACEESQAVCKAFRKKGHEAYSCDIQTCSGEHPEWHIQSDVIPLLNGFCSFETMDGVKHYIDSEWDLIIAHPPCTYLTVAANKLYNIEKYGEKAEKRLKDREDASNFFLQFVNANCEHKAIENPIGVMSTIYRKPDQIIQPYQFGHPVRKSTCLWLYNLPKLEPTNIVEPEFVKANGKGRKYSGNLYGIKREDGKYLQYTDPELKRMRSKTYQGIADAMAEQWGCLA